MLGGYSVIQASRDVCKDFPDLKGQAGLEEIAGLLYIPLQAGGDDFIVFLRKGRSRHIQPSKPKIGHTSLEVLHTRSEAVESTSRTWTPAQIELAGVLSRAYGKVSVSRLDFVPPPTLTCHLSA